MKILLTLNKTHRGYPDSNQWYVKEPLENLGHDVYQYDTVKGHPGKKTYSQIIEEFKPDLIFCMMTGDARIAPMEPWQEVEKETDSGRTTTFNWFCDDTWRFDSFSSLACRSFNVCSTPEKYTLSKYKEIGYNNIIVGNWHANRRCYNPVNFTERPYAASFIGAPNPMRVEFFKGVTFPVNFVHNVSQEELFKFHSSTQIGINLSRNYNDESKQTQMKQRLFEIPAGAGLLLTEYHHGIEELFEINEEMVIFHNPQELNEQVVFLKRYPKIAESIAHNGYQRFLKEHDSHVRLAKLIEKIVEY